MYVPQRELEASAPIFRTKTLTPGRLFDLPATRVQEIVGDAAHVGDHWLLDAGRSGSFHFTVERFVLGYKDCGEAWGVVGTVASAEGRRFAAVRDKYYAARLDLTPAAARPATTLGPVQYVLDEHHRSELIALLEGERQRTWPAVRDEAQIDRARAEARGLREPLRWKALDERFDRGEGQLRFDYQTFRLTPDGDPRLFVRAWWRIDRNQVYAVVAWIRVSRTLTIDYTDASASRWMRFGEFRSQRLDNSNLGLVLSVFDLDGDGQAEILMSVTGYESRNLDLFVYPRSPESSPVKITTYSDGC